jgi:hypothetical protein
MVLFLKKTGHNFSEGKQKEYTSMHENSVIYQSQFRKKQFA